MVSEIKEYRIMQNEDDNSVVVYKDEKPFIRAVLTRSLTSFQMAGYWPMIRSRVERIVTVISDMTPKEIMIFLEDVNWMTGPLTHFEYVGA
jgi:hypothetical protein